jgi:hypothetical protein
MMPYNKQTGGGLLPDGRPAGKWRSAMPYIVVLVCLVILAGGYYAWKYLRVAKQPKQVVVSDTIELKIYYPLPPAKLAVKGVPVKADATDKEKADVIISALKTNRVLPEGIVLTDLAADPDGTLLLNFSPEMATMKLDPITEIQTVYAIIDSFLANFTKAKSVQLLAGGQAFFTINGTVYTYKPLEFNTQILED